LLYFVFFFIVFLYLSIIWYGTPRASIQSVTKGGLPIIRDRDSHGAALSLYKRGPVRFGGENGSVLLWVGPTVRLDTLPPLFAPI